MLESTHPLVSILWLNYNSYEFRDIVLESLRGIKDLDYPNYELIALDNGSYDGSFDIIRGVIQKMGGRFKIIRLDRNIGFTGGNNIAYKSRSNDSKYVVLLNNDAIPYCGSLTNLVRIMDNDEKLGSAQGVILNYEGQSIDTAGGFDSELLTSYLFLNGNEPDSLRKEICISHANGSYAIYRVDSIRRSLGVSDRVLDADLFSLREDDLIGFKLWNAGFRVKSFPFVAARHKRGSSFGRIGLTGLYLSIRNHLILNEISNSRYKIAINLNFARYLRIPLSIMPENDPVKRSKRAVVLRVIQKAIFDGKSIGRKKRKAGDTIDIYKAPIVKVNASIGAISFAIPNRILQKGINKELARGTFSMLDKGSNLF